MKGLVKLGLWALTGYGLWRLYQDAQERAQRKAQSADRAAFWAAFAENADAEPISPIGMGVREDMARSRHESAAYREAEQRHAAAERLARAELGLDTRLPIDDPPAGPSDAADDGPVKPRGRIVIYEDTGAQGPVRMTPVEPENDDQTGGH